LVNLTTGFTKCIWTVGDRRPLGAQRNGREGGERDGLHHPRRRHQGGEAIRHAQQGKDRKRGLRRLLYWSAQGKVATTTTTITTTRTKLTDKNHRTTIIATETKTAIITMATTIVETITPHILKMYYKVNF